MGKHDATSDMDKDKKDEEKKSRLRVPGYIAKDSPYKPKPKKGKSQEG